MRRSSTRPRSSSSGRTSRPRSGPTRPGSARTTPTRSAASRQERDGVIYVSGSGQLVRGLIRDGLVDEVHLFVYPISLGEGERFWAEGEQNKLVLQAHDVYDNGVVHLSYGLA